MDWLKKHYDRVMLAVLGILVAAFAGLIIFNTMSFPVIFESRDSRKPPSDKIEEPNIAFITAQLTAVREPAQWNASEGSLFVSKPYILRDGQLVAPLQPGSSPIHPPVPNEWLVKYDLDYADPNILEADPDSDKFTVLEEFLGNTDPTAADSKPAFYTKLRLKEFIQVPFRLKFSGSPDDGQTFTINTRDLKQPTQFLKIGDMVEGTTYKVTNYEAKSADKDGLTVDISELTVENQETQEKILLVFDQEVNYPTGFADLVYTYDGTEQRVQKDDEFSIAPETDVKYKLIDISEAEAVIQQTSSGEQFKVPPLKQ